MGKNNKWKLKSIQNLRNIFLSKAELVDIRLRNIKYRFRTRSDWRLFKSRLNTTLFYCLENLRWRLHFHMAIHHYSAECSQSLVNELTMQLRLKLLFPITRSTEFPRSFCSSCTSYLGNRTVRLRSGSSPTAFHWKTSNRRPFKTEESTQSCRISSQLYTSSSIHE